MITVQMKWEGVTKAQYDQIRKLVDWDSNRAPGSVLHIAAFDDKGMRVADVWQSEADLNNFIGTRLMSAVMQLGIQTQPVAEVFPVHNLYTPDFTPKRVLEAA